LPIALAAGAVAALALLAVTFAPAPARRAGRGDRLGAGPGRLASVAPARRPVSPEAAVSLSRGLIAYWRFDEAGTSKVARDRSGQGNDCVLRERDPSSHWTEGMAGGAVTLDGRGWLACSRVDSWASLSKELSISGWVKRSSGHPGLRALVSRQQGDDSADYFVFGFNERYLIFSSSVWGARLRLPVAATYDRWTHVAATRAADGTLILYADGAEVGRTAGDPATSISGGPNALLIGGGLNVPDPDRPTELFDGSIDELLIYRRALAPDEVGALAAGAEPRL
jgi:hypothetical protein